MFVKVAGTRRGLLTCIPDKAWVDVPEPKPELIDVELEMAPVIFVAGSAQARATGLP